MIRFPRWGAAFVQATALVVALAGCEAPGQTAFLDYGFYGSRSYGHLGDYDDLATLLSEADMDITWASDSDVDLGDGKIRNGIYYGIERTEAEALEAVAQKPPRFAAVMFTKLYNLENDFEVLHSAKEKAEKLRAAGCKRVIVTTAHSVGTGYIYDTAKENAPPPPLKTEH